MFRKAANLPPAEDTLREATGRTATHELLKALETAKIEAEGHKGRSLQTKSP